MRPGFWVHINCETALFCKDKYASDKRRLSLRSCADRSGFCRCLWLARKKMAGHQGENGYRLFSGSWRKSKYEKSDFSGLYIKKSENKRAAAHQGGCMIRKLSCFPDITKGNYRNKRVSLIRSRTGGRSSWPEYESGKARSLRVRLNSVASLHPRLNPGAVGMLK